MSHVLHSTTLTGWYLKVGGSYSQDTDPAGMQDKYSEVH